MEWTDIIARFVWLLTVLGIVSGVVVVSVIGERRISGFIQGRWGPNRVNFPVIGRLGGILPGGLAQPMADVIKFVFKENVIPRKADGFLYRIAPLFTMIPPYLVLVVIPMGPGFSIGEKFLNDWLGLGMEGALRFEMVGANLDIGVLFILAFLSMGVYGLALGGWASNNKYSLMGGLRASAQVISYEIALTLSFLTVMVLAQDVNLTAIVQKQVDGTWFVFTPPGFICFFVFFTAALAENNRLPFDLPECDAELVGGFHTEYSGTRFALFFMGEYVSMTVMSMLMTLFFFGGWDPLPWNDGGVLANWLGGIVGGVAGLAIFLGKTFFSIFIYIVLRWTLPRYRYDQLMNIGWKVLIPIALVNLLLAAVWRSVGLW